MKQDLYRYMPIDLYQMKAYWDDLAQIEVRFSRTKDGAPLKTAIWEPGNTEECYNEGTMLMVRWTREETYMIPENTAFWVDVRPTFTSGLDYKVPTFQQVMEWSIFEDARVQNRRNTGWIVWNDVTKTLTIM